MIDEELHSRSKASESSLPLKSDVVSHLAKKYKLSPFEIRLAYRLNLKIVNNPNAKSEIDSYVSSTFLTFIEILNYYSAEQLSHIIKSIQGSPTEEIIVPDVLFNNTFSYKSRKPLVMAISEEVDAILDSKKDDISKYKIFDEEVRKYFKRAVTVAGIETISPIINPFAEMQTSRKRETPHLTKYFFSPIEPDIKLTHNILETWTENRLHPKKT